MAGFGSLAPDDAGYVAPPTPAAPTWQDQEAAANVAAYEAMRRRQGPSWGEIGSGVMDRLKGIASLPGRAWGTLASTPTNPYLSAPAHPSTGFVNNIADAEGQAGDPRLAESIARGGANIAKDVAVGIPQRAIDASKRDIENFQNPDPNYVPDVGPATEAAMLTMGLGSFGAERGAAGIFGGKLAQTADHAKLARAEEMHAAGAPREDIWKETGWFQGPDQKWRFEIPDDAARLKPTGPGNPSAFPIDQLGTHDIGDAVHHPELFQAYPDLATRPLEVTQGEGFRGAYDRGNDTVMLANRKAQAVPAGPKDYRVLESGVGTLKKNGEPLTFPTKEEAEAHANLRNDEIQRETRSTTLHELQHAVQSREGFARGGNAQMPEVVRSAQQDFSKDHRAAQQTLEILDTHRDSWIQKFADDNGLDLKSGDRADLIRAIKAYRLNNPVQDAARMKAYDFVAQNENITPPMYRQNAYRRLAGETEARNVQTRDGFGPEYSRDVPPWQSADVPDKNQIVSFHADQGMAHDDGGSRLNPFQNADQQRELANQRRARGMATGKSAPGWDFKRPDPPKGSFDRAVAEAKAGWQADRDYAREPFIRAANPYMKPEDWEEVAKPGFVLGSGPTDKRSASTLLAHPAVRQAFHDEMGPQAGQRAFEEYLAQHGPETAPTNAADAAPRALDPASPPRGDGSGGTGGGSGGLEQAQAAAARRAGAGKPLEGLPTKAMKIGDEHFVPGPIAAVRDVAEKYMADRPKSAYFPPPTKYHPLDEEHARNVAKAFDEMKHAPNDPATKASYDALARETLAQYKAVKASGLKIEPIPPGMADPYAANPRLAAKDVADNNHLWFFPTDQGFGSNPGSKINLKTHPMMQKTGEKIGDHELLVNDLFRVVHDYFGHLKEGHGFRAAGEDNAWRSHASMYSDLARPAMTTETRGQNSWVNYGPHGEANRKASAADTVYADQKVGLMPEWTMRDRTAPKPVIAYHGTPHKFEAFDPTKIGTGEGAEVYGKGLYFAENPKVAKMYRDQLAKGNAWEKNGEPVPPWHVDEEMIKAIGQKGTPAREKYSGDIVSHITAGLENGLTTKQLRSKTHAPDPDLYGAPSGEFFDAYNRALDVIDKGGYRHNLKPGHTFEVAIDHPPEKFLDWDKPFKEQHPDVQAAVRPHLEERLAAQKAARAATIERANSGNKWAASSVRNWKPVTPLEDLKGQQIHEMLGLPAKDREEGFTKAAERLKDAGVPGIRYLDQGSRTKRKNQTRNYVTFDAPRVLKRYAIPGMIGAGGFGTLAPGLREEQ